MPQSSSPETDSASVKFSSNTHFIFLLILAAAFLVAGRVFHFDPSDFKTWLLRFPLLGSGLIFILVYVVGTFFVWIGLKDILRFAAAAVYGPYLSTLFVSLAEMGNLLTMFGLSRRLGRDYVERRLSGKLRQVDQMISEAGPSSIFFLRAFPIIPFRFLDLGFGLTRISLMKYFLISLVGSPPRIFFVQFYLSVGMETILDPGKMQDYLMAHPVVWWVSSIYAFAALGTILLIKRSGRRAQVKVTPFPTGKE